MFFVEVADNYTVYNYTSSEIVAVPMQYYIKYSEGDKAHNTMQTT